MVARTVIVIGIVLGGIGLAGSLLMLLVGAEGANPGMAVFWGVVLGLSLYWDYRKHHRVEEQE